MFIPMVSINVWVALIAGGSGSNKGAVLGAFVLMGFSRAPLFKGFHSSPRRISALQR